MDNILEKGSFPGLAADSEVSVLGEMPVLGQSTRRGSRVAAKASIGMLRAGVAPEVNPWDLAEQDRIEVTHPYQHPSASSPAPPSTPHSSALFNAPAEVHGLP